MKKIILLAALLASACGDTPPTAQDIARAQAAQKEQQSALFKEMNRFARQETTVICVAGSQYMAWYDIVSTHRVYHLVPLFDDSNRSWTRGCTGGVSRDLEYAREKSDGEIDRNRDDRPR